MRARRLDDVPVVVGGIIPGGDAASLRKAGVAALFGPGTSTADVVAAFRELAGPARGGGRRDRAAPAGRGGPPPPPE